MSEEGKEETKKENSTPPTEQDEAAAVKVSNVVVEMMYSLASIGAIKKCLANGQESKDARMATAAHDAFFESVKGYLDDSNLKNLEELDVSSYVNELFTTLSSLGYLKMGLPENNAKYRDMEDAKIAIDSFSGLLKAMEADMEEETRKQMSALMANLQMSYASLSKDKK